MTVVDDIITIYITGGSADIVIANIAGKQTLQGRHINTDNNNVEWVHYHQHERGKFRCRDCKSCISGGGMLKIVQADSEPTNTRWPRFSIINSSKTDQNISAWTHSTCSSSLRTRKTRICLLCLYLRQIDRWIRYGGYPLCFWAAAIRTKWQWSRCWGQKNRYLPVPCWRNPQISWAAETVKSCTELSADVHMARALCTGMLPLDCTDDEKLLHKSTPRSAPRTEEECPTKCKIAIQLSSHLFSLCAEGRKEIRPQLNSLYDSFGLFLLCPGVLCMIPSGCRDSGKLSTLFRLEKRTKKGGISSLTKSLYVVLCHMVRMAQLDITVEDWYNSIQGFDSWRDIFKYVWN